MDGLGRAREQLREQCRVEAIDRQLEVQELLGVDQAPGVVVPGHQPVLRDHHLARGVLRIAELIANHLEDEVEGLEREHVHHQAGIALRMHEEIAAPAQVIGKAPEAFGLALAQASQHGVELVDGLAGQDRMQELHRADDRGGVREVIGAGVAEDVADLRFLEQHRVDADAARGVLERHDDRKLAALMDDASHEVGAGALEEVGVDEFETAESTGADVEAVPRGRRLPPP